MMSLVSTPWSVRQKPDVASESAAIAVKTPSESAASGASRAIVAHGLTALPPTGARIVQSATFYSDFHGFRINQEIGFVKIQELSKP